MRAVEFSCVGLSRLIFAVAMVSPSLASEVLAAEPALGKRGLITSSECPFGCRDLGLSRESCREWEAGDLCYVEDLLQAPGHRSMMKGFGFSDSEVDAVTVR